VLLFAHISMAACREVCVEQSKWYCDRGSNEQFDEEFVEQTAIVSREFMFLH